jgi:hypothetical protein
MKRIIFLNRFFYPDHSAASQILSDLAFHLAGDRNDIHVITSQQRYDNSRAGLPASDRSAVSPSTAYPRRNSDGRIWSDGDSTMRASTSRSGVR